jgi:hypothetical protein
MLYTLLGIGALGAFLGHGAWAVQGKASFVTLLTGSFDHVLGVTVSNDTGEAWVRGIGWFDLAVSVVIAALVVGAYTQRGKLYDLAYSRLAIVLFSWAAFWGFVTAASRITAVGTWFPEFWDLVERAPNFMLPLALIYVIRHHRDDNTPSEVTVSSARIGVTH